MNVRDNVGQLQGNAGNASDFARQGCNIMCTSRMALLKETPNTCHAWLLLVKTSNYYAYQ